MTDRNAKVSAAFANRGTKARNSVQTWPGRINNSDLPSKNRDLRTDIVHLPVRKVKNRVIVLLASAFGDFATGKALSGLTGPKVSWKKWEERHHPPLGVKVQTS
jgi:hypothetical protein